MARYEVTGPDGARYEITAPDGASEAQVMAYAKAQFGKQQPRDTSRLRGFVGGVLKPIDNAAEALQTGVNAVLGTNFQGASQAARENDAMRANNTRKGMQVVGNIVGTTPTLAIGGGAAAPAIQGAVGGALLSNERTAGGILTDAGLGAIAGKAGELAVRGVQRAIAPKVADATRRLLDQGIELTSGQVAGRTAKTMEDAATSLIGAGPVVGQAQRRAIESMNRAAYNRVLKPLGQAVPKNAPVGHEGIDAVHQRISAEYGKLVPQLRANLDKPFTQAVDRVRQAASLAPQQQARFEQVIKDVVGRAFDPKTGRASGQALKAMDEKLNDLAAGYRASGDVDNRMLGAALQDVRGELFKMMGRTNPGASSQLRRINAAFANLVRVERAALNSADGVFTPEALKQAVSAADRSGRKANVARGRALMQDFSRDVSEVMGRTLNNSGTAERGMLNVALLGGTAVDPTTLVAPAVVAGAYTRPAQTAARAALGRQAGPTAQRASQALTPLRSAGAAVGPALLLRPDE